MGRKTPRPRVSANNPLSVDYKSLLDSHAEVEPTAKRFRINTLHSDTRQSGTATRDDSIELDNRFSW